MRYGADFATAIGDAPDPGFTDGAMSMSLKVLSPSKALERALPKLIKVGKKVIQDLNDNLNPNDSMAVLLAKEPMTQFIAVFTPTEEDPDIWDYVGRIPVNQTILDILMDT